MKENKNCGRVKSLWLIFCVSMLAVFGANCSKNLSSNAEQLAPGKPVMKSIVNDEIHSYTVELEKGQFLALAIEQSDVDVITKVYAPNDELIGEFDTPTSGRGTEAIRIGADAGGELPD